MSSDLAHEEFGRYFSSKDHSTSHPEDRTDDSHSDHLSEKETSRRAYRVDDAQGSDDDSLHDYNTGNMSATATATYQLPTTLFDANTGPKGVIADAVSFERAKKRSFRQTLYNIAQNTLRSSSKEGRSSSPENSASEADQDEEEFMRTWRENRLRELQNGSMGQRRASPSKRRYGSLDDVDANGYLDAVEKLPSDTIVVVCVYDPESLPSSEVEKSLSTIARRYPTTRFVKLHHEIAEMDHMGVPAILAYKGGDVFSTVMNIKQSQRDVESLEAVLLEHRMVI